MLYNFVGCPKMDFCVLTKIHFRATNKIIEYSYFYCTLTLKFFSGPQIGPSNDYKRCQQIYSPEKCRQEINIYKKLYKASKNCEIDK